MKVTCLHTIERMHFYIKNSGFLRRFHMVNYFLLLLLLKAEISLLLCRWVLGWLLQLQVGRGAFSRCIWCIRGCWTRR